MSWTDERVEKLKEYWAEGMSASQIAKQLGGVTRNAVIGKVHRLGLSHRAAAEPQPAAEEAAAAAPADAVPEAADPAEPAPAAEPAETAAPAPAEAVAEDAPAPAAESPEEAGPGLAAERSPAAAAPVALRDPTQPRPPGAPTPEEEAARTTLAEIEKMARKLDLMELTERTCKWPIGDPAEDGFHFCGLPSVQGKPYCRHHVAIAFQPMSPRRDRVRIGR